MVPPQLNPSNVAALVN